MNIHNTSLYYKDASSDKVYHTQVKSHNDGFLVDFQYGRRNSTLIAGSKTAKPVTQDEALKIYNKLVKDKKSKGYTEGVAGAIFQSTTLEDKFTGIVPQLLNKIENYREFIDSNEFFMQEKKDGHRRIIKVQAGKVTSINKKGLEVLSPECVCTPITSLNKDIIVDGELIGDKYFIFDIISYEGNDLKEKTALERFKILDKLALPNTVPAYFTKTEKLNAFKKFESEKKEGVVFKNKSSTYVPGRPNSGGNQLKYKFYATDTFEVLSHSKARRSIGIISYTQQGEQYDMGKVTIAETTPMPPVGSFVEVRYLYCNAGGKLFQTTYLNQRVDQDKSDCHMKEIKFKNTDDQDED